MLPTADSLIASDPYPFLTISCPGNNANVLSPGMPRNKPGNTSKKVCVIASDAINAMISSGLMELEETTRDNRIAQIVLTWIPGINPVKNPIIIPSIIAKGISIIQME
jgi:hypothetical protein